MKLFTVEILRKDDSTQARNAIYHIGRFGKDKTANILREKSECLVAPTASDAIQYYENAGWLVKSITYQHDIHGIIGMIPVPVIDEASPTFMDE